MDDAPRELDIPALARRYGRDLASDAYGSLQHRGAAEAAAAAGIADVLRSHGMTTIRDGPHLAGELMAATQRRARAAERRTREVDPPLDLGAASAPPSFSVTAEAVDAALAAAPRSTPTWSPGRWSAVAAAGVVVVALGFGAWQMTTPSEESAAAPIAPRPGGFAADGLGGLQGPALARLIHPTLADCQIQPASGPLGYRGWLMLGDLTLTLDPAAAARPVYALVTAGDAEWVGWQGGEARAMYPRPVGRLACAVDPTSGGTAVYGVAGDWQPPAMVDGCPATDVHTYGAFKEIGGPQLFATLPTSTGTWRAGDPSVELYLRLPRPPPGRARVAATARPLGPGSALELAVSRQSTSPPSTPASNLYLTLSNVAFPSAGCWVVSVAVDGQVLGSAVLPVTGPA